MNQLIYVYYEHPQENRLQRSSAMSAWHGASAQTKSYFCNNKNLLKPINIHENHWHSGNTGIAVEGNWSEQKAYLHVGMPKWRTHK